jgi:hypothetical protein
VAEGAALVDGLDVGAADGVLVGAAVGFAVASNRLSVSNQCVGARVLLAEDMGGTDVLFETACIIGIFRVRLSAIIF